MAALPAPDHYEALGVAFCVATDSPVVRDFFRAAYGRFRSPGPPAGGSLRLLARFGGAGGPIAVAGAQMLRLSGRRMPENRAFLFLLNALMDRISDCVAIHGAAVSVDGQGVVIAGPPTAGKSTLVMELCRRGALFYSDDVAPVERRTGLLRPFPRAIGIRKDPASLAGTSPAALTSGAHELPHKWLVDPASLGLSLPAPGQDACPVRAVFYLDVARTGGEREVRTLEMGTVETDHGLLRRLASIDGVSGVREADGAGFPILRFETRRAARPMRALADLCRSRRDVVLYLEEARETADRPAAPEIREASWPPLLLELTRDLLNRGEQGALMRSCGSLPLLVAEMGRLLSGARAFRLRPGSPDRTAGLILATLGSAGSARSDDGGVAA